MNKRLNVTNNYPRAATQLEDEPLAVALQHRRILVDRSQEEGVSAPFLEARDDGLDRGGRQRIRIVVRVAHFRYQLDIVRIPETV